MADTERVDCDATALLLQTMAMALDEAAANVAGHGYPSVKGVIREWRRDAATLAKAALIVEKNEVLRGVTGGMVLQVAAWNMGQPGLPQLMDDTEKQAAQEEEKQDGNVG